MLWRAARAADDQRRARLKHAFQSSFLTDARLLHETLNRRVEPQALLQSHGFMLWDGKPVALTGDLPGSRPIAELADYLEAMAKQLPSDNQ